LQWRVFRPALFLASFLDHGEIDEFRIHLIPIPTLIGEGIPLGCLPESATIRLLLPPR